MVHHLEEVRAAIIKAVPEIVELKFGCELTQQGINFLVVGATPAGQPITVKKTGVHDSSKGPGASMEKFEGKTQILGRPIRLADVLVAITGKAVVALDKDELFISDVRGEDLRTHGYWNLRTDDLSRQTECVKWHVDLMKSENSCMPGVHWLSRGEI